jgi:aminoglycoside phosphotransferase (APT) family kinase protein
VSRPADATRPVRPGEELDTEALASYLSRELGGSGGVEVEQFPGGHSNLTYLIRFAGAEYVLRRPPFGTKVKTAHDMGREYTVLSHLAGHYDKAPRPILHCTDESVVGAPFYLMQRLHGLILRRELPAGLAIDEGQAMALSEVLVDTLAELHNLDYQALGLGDFGKPAGYIERQVSGWTRRYEGSRTDDIPAIEEVAAWLAEHRPADGPPALIHNDFKFDNTVLDPGDLTRIIGILDWEMATIGDPRMDLGTALCYWIQADDAQPLLMLRFGPTHLPGMLTRRQVADRWAERTGRDPGDVVFFYAFGLFKTAVVAQQIYYRYAKGLTKDARFAQLIFGVRLLAEQAQRSISSGRL